MVSVVPQGNQHCRRLQQITLINVNGCIIGKLISTQVDIKYYTDKEMISYIIWKI